MTSENRGACLGFVCWLPLIDNTNILYENGQLTIKSDHCRPFKAIS